MFMYYIYFKKCKIFNKVRELTNLKFIYVYTSCMYLLGAVYSWGDGDYGKLGRGGNDGCKTPKVIEKLMGQDVVRVYCGNQFSMALTKSGAVYTW